MYSILNYKVIYCSLHLKYKLYFGGINFLYWYYVIYYLDNICEMLKFLRKKVSIITSSVSIKLENID